MYRMKFTLNYANLLSRDPRYERISIEWCGSLSERVFDLCIIDNAPEDSHLDGLLKRAHELENLKRFPPPSLKASP